MPSPDSIAAAPGACLPSGDEVLRSGIRRGATAGPTARPIGKRVVPDDLPRALAAGPDIQRVLLIECGWAGSVGVVIHELSLGGCLARELKKLTGRGQIVDTVHSNRATLRSVIETVAAQPLWRFDAVVIMLSKSNPIETLLGRRKQAEKSRELVRELEQLCSHGTRAVIVGIEHKSEIVGLVSKAALVVQEESLNNAMRRSCLSSLLVDFVEVTTGDRREGRKDDSTVADYKSWGRAIGPRLSSSLASLPAQIKKPFSGSAREKRDQQQLESERLAALHSIRLEQWKAGENIRRIVGLLRQSYGTPYAALNVIDQDKQWTWVVSGPDDLGDIALSSSFCATTVQHDAPMIVPDAREDLLFADYQSVKDGMLRFYAGLPIESADGLRIGALCVFDPDARTDSTFDPGMLTTLAHRIETQLWEIEAAG